MHSLTQPYTALYSHAQPWTPNFLICFMLWHVILCLSHSDLTLYSILGTLACENPALANKNRFGAKNSGMWNSALVIFHLALTNHPISITNHPLSLPITPFLLPITPLSLPITHFYYQSPYFYYQLPHFHYRSPTFITHHSISITNHPKPYYQSPPKLTNPSFYLVIAKPLVEYKRSPIFWLPGHTVPVFSASLTVDQVPKSVYIQISFSKLAAISRGDQLGSTVF